MSARRQPVAAAADDDLEARDVIRRPGGELATRPLHFIWIADCSGSMGSHGKIQALNNAVREAVPHMQQVADENPNAQVLVRAVRFASGAQWHIAQAGAGGRLQVDRPRRRRDDGHGQGPVPGGRPS